MPENEGQDNQGQSEDQGGAGDGEGQGQDQGQDDRGWLPEDLRDEKSLEAIKDVPALAKSYVEGQKLIGGSVRIPGEDATPEEIEAFHVKMGRPGKVEEYGFVKPELPEGINWDEGRVEWFGKTCLDIGVSKVHANKLMQAWNDNEFSIGHAGQKELAKEVQDLKDLWGDKYGGNVELGVRAIERLLPAAEVKEFNAIMDATGAGNKTVILKAYHAMGKILKEDGYIVGDGHGGVHGAESAKAKIEEINKDLKHPWHSGDKAALAEMDQLFKTAFPK